MRGNITSGGWTRWWRALARAKSLSTRVTVFTGVVASAAALIFSMMNPGVGIASVPGINAGIDVSTSGGSPNLNSGRSGVSQDGRYVVFDSRATNLTTPAPSAGWQIYVRDRLDNTTEPISVSSAGVFGNDDSQWARISADGRYVVFESTADNLVSGDSNGYQDVFIRDRSENTTRRVSVSASQAQGNNSSFDADVSADGRYVTFRSSATNLVPNPTISYGGVFLKDLETDSVELLSQNAAGVAANEVSFQPRISCEGKYVIFASLANNLVTGDTNNPNKDKTRVYIADTAGGDSPKYITGFADGNTDSASISCNGSYIAFLSSATNIVTGDTNGTTDAFVYDRINDSFSRVSVSSTGSEVNSGVFDSPSVSNDGKYIVFSTAASNLVTSDTNNNADVFLHNSQAHTTELVSRNSTGVLSNGFSYAPVITSDGRYAVYSSTASNLVSGFSNSNGAIYAAQTGTTNDY